MTDDIRLTADNGPILAGEVTAAIVEEIAARRSRGILPWWSRPASEEREIARRHFPEIDDAEIARHPEAVAQPVWQIQQCLRCQLGVKQRDGSLGRCNLEAESGVIDPNGYGGTKLHYLRHRRLPYVEGEVMRYEWTMHRCEGPEKRALELARFEAGVVEVGGFTGTYVDDDGDAGTVGGRRRAGR